MTRLFGLAIGALVAALNATPAAAALPTPASGVTWDRNQRVEYRWKEGSEPPAWARSAMSAAAADSNSSRKSKAAIFSYDSSGPAWLAYTDDLPTNWAIGYTVRSIPDSFTIRMRPHGTQLDWGTLRWCEFYDGEPPNGCYDLEMVTLHEFGHAQTLGHVDEAQIDTYTDSLMHATGLRSKPKAGWNQHVFGRCDVARLQIRYEPLTGRSVVLQRRALGSTAWATIGEMSAVTDNTGRYVKTMTLTTTYDWRAVFSAPGDEGLDGAISSISRLSVTYGCTPTGIGRGVDPLYETC